MALPGRGRPLSAPPLPKPPIFTAFDHSGAQRGRVPRRYVPQRLQTASLHDVFPRILGLHHGTGRSLPDDAGRAHLPFPDPLNGLADYSEAHGGPAEGAPCGPMVAHTHLLWLCIRRCTHSASRVEWQGANMERTCLQSRDLIHPRPQSYGGARQYLRRADRHLHDHFDSRLCRDGYRVYGTSLHGL